MLGPSSETGGLAPASVPYLLDRCARGWEGAAMADLLGWTRERAYLARASVLREQRHGGIARGPVSRWLAIFSLARTEDHASIAVDDFSCGRHNGAAPPPVAT